MSQIITTVVKETQLLPHFLDHYRKNGFEKINLLVNTHKQSNLYRKVKRFTDKTVKIVDVYNEEYLSVRRSMREEAYVDSEVEGWFAYADLDEFTIYPLPLREILEKAESSGCNFVNSYFVDRVAPHGELIEVSTSSIWNQFPFGCFLTRNILMGSPSKIVLLKKGMNTDAGHHRIDTDRSKITPVPCDLIAETHHFKWFKGVTERLRERIKSLKENRMAHWTESYRFLKWMTETNNRIDLSHSALWAMAIYDQPYEPNVQKRI